ncbi:MAG TPA: nematoblast specific protein, partial [Saprospiraceae bacterium]|nr:nematoblast specific protein [Saprospiraceae bacterium]
AKFTADATARSGARKDFAGGVSTDGLSFYLKNCGFFNDKVDYDTYFERKPQGREPNIDFLMLPH